MNLQDAVRERRRMGRHKEARRRKTLTFRLQEAQNYASHPVLFPPAPALLPAAKRIVGKGPLHIYDVQQTSKSSTFEYPDPLET